MPLRRLFENNRRWSEGIIAEDSGFFSNLAHLQAPEILWIGCSDSRVPANEIVGLLPGEVFVHRNIANLVHPADMNCLSVVQYAVDNLKVRHIVVVGHYGCGGIGAVVRHERLGLIDNWLQPVRRLNEAQYWEPAALEQQRWDRLCELNVVEQVRCLAETTVVRDAWQRGQPISIHGWIYSLQDGLLHDLKVTASCQTPGITVSG